METAKHPVFQFRDAAIALDNKLICVALAGGEWVAMMSSRIHFAWALAAGGWLGVGNDPVCVKTSCIAISTNSARR